jgi:hypothetical protein
LGRFFGLFPVVLIVGHPSLLLKNHVTFYDMN